MSQTKIKGSQLDSATLDLSATDGSVLNNVNAVQLEGQNGAFYRNAANLNAGIVPTSRLSGTYNINISGQASIPVPFKGAVVRPGSTVSIPTATLTIIPFQFELEDTNNFHDAINNSRLTIPSGVSRVIVSANIRWENLPSISGRTYFTDLLLNGISQNPASLVGELPSIGSTFRTTVLSYPYLVSPGDYFEVRVYQNTGSTLTLHNFTWFAIQAIE